MHGSMSGVFSLPDQTHRDESFSTLSTCCVLEVSASWGLSVLLLRWMCLKRQRFCRWAVSSAFTSLFELVFSASYTADPCRSDSRGGAVVPQSHTDTCRGSTTQITTSHDADPRYQIGKTMVNLSSLQPLT